jgi:tetratricopeptide (TPR) repeat protein
MVMHLVLLEILAADVTAGNLPRPGAADEDLFVQAYLIYRSGENDRAAAEFRKLYDRFPRHPIGAIAAYNAACSLALQGNAQQSLEWLGRALRAGYDNLDHCEGDGDLALVRAEAEYDRLLREARGRRRKAMAPVAPDQIGRWAERISKAAAAGDSASVFAACSRLGWFTHEPTVRQLNALLTKQGLEFVRSGGAWSLDGPQAAMRER